MSDAHQHCPVAGCGVRRDNLLKRGRGRSGRGRRWYSVDSNSHLLVGRLDEALAALPCNDHICPNCYKRIRRPPPSAPSALLDTLAAAAADHHDEPPHSPPPQPPPPPPPPPQPLRPPPPPPLPIQPPPSPASAHQLSSPPPISPVTLHRSASTTKRALLNLVNEQLPDNLKRVRSSRVREFSQTEKQYLLDDWEKGDEWTRWRLEWFYNLDRQKRYRWRKTLDGLVTLPERERSPMHMRRVSGQRWLPTNALIVERKILDAVMAMRHKRLPVTMKQLRAVAIKFTEKESFKASAKFALSFIKRWRLSQRARTTTKEISTFKVSIAVLGWRAYFWKRMRRPDGNWVDPATLWNMDETSVYLDMPPAKTLDMVGAKSVEIATTRHEYTRVAVVLCCNRVGTMIDPLVIHKCHKDAKKQNEVRRMFVQTNDGQDVCMYVTKNESGWLNGFLMQQWIRQVFTPAMTRDGRKVQEQCLYMDNCSAHTTADVWNAMLQGKFQFEYFPPNCTPILQPCDMNINREFKRVWTSCWLDWFINVGSTPANWTKEKNPRKASDSVVHAWIARCMLAMTEKTVRDSWDRSACADMWWWLLLDSAVVERIVPMLGDDGLWCWLMYELYSRRKWDKTVLDEPNVSGRTKKKTESKEEHDTRLAGYAAMERSRRERYESPMVYDSDDEKVDETKEAEQLEAEREAERLVEQLEECQVGDSGDETDTDVEMDEDKENRPPPASERERIREERYQQMQTELSASGSSRVLDKRVTSGLWAGREAMQAPQSL